MSMKVLKPSSIHASRRSLDCTIMGNQVWPTSCAVTTKRPLVLELMPSKTMAGYSMPEEKPATLVMTGQGKGYQSRDMFSMVSLVYSVVRPQPSFPAASGG